MEYPDAGREWTVKTLAGVTILLSVVGFLIAVRAREHETPLQAVTKFLLLLLSLCGGALAFLYLIRC